MMMMMIEVVESSWVYLVCSFVSCGGVAGGGSMMIEVVGSISPVALSVVVVLLGVEV